MHTPLPCTAINEPTASPTLEKIPDPIPTNRKSDTSMTANEATKEQWLASDWDEPLDVAFVFNSIDDKEASNNEGRKCGHALRW